MLTAIAIPVFTTQLERSREATDMSNLRAAYAEAMAAYMANGANSTATASVSAKQQQASWQNAENGKLYTRIDGTESEVSVGAKTAGQSWVVTVGSASNGGTSIAVN